MTRIRVAVIGATGSVGSSVLDVIRRFPDRFSVSSLAAGANADKLLTLAREFRVPVACLVDPSSEDMRRFREAGIELIAGQEGLAALAESPETDNAVFASSGTDAAVALQRALIADKNVSLANKESIVAAGPWVMPLVRRADQLRPVDSEHSAIWQCLRGEPKRSIEKIYLTASGGPFRNMPPEAMARVTPEDALRHPTWAMGPKITVDSATLMNKGIECIEAMQLFDLPASRVGALVHPASQVHGIVTFSDATVKLLLSAPDMRLPAAAALAWPERLNLPEADFSRANPQDWSLAFSEPDAERFPCFTLALEAGRRGGAYPPLLIGADEVAVTAFLEKRIPFSSISIIIENTLERFTGTAPATLQDAIELIADGKRVAAELCGSL